MALSPGTRLGAYEIVGAIGAGGMGEVYRARDTKLDRDVAIKVLPEAFAADPDRIARFQREAKTLASLNHPHIGAIYGLEESNGIKALVLELVEGPTLADRIAQAPLPLDEALPIAKQTAEALEAAHEHGIIHRDLKPANIKLKSDGTVKVLDFGLAKAMEPPDVGRNLPSPNLSMSPTITSPAMTMGGVVLGTAAYMSPEQAKGKPVDRRTDMWAFGCVLYEMLTGVRAFEGEDVSDTLAEILKSEPDLKRLPPHTPPAITRLLRRCLVKDRRMRLADAGAARIEIDEAGTPAGHIVQPPASQRSRRAPIVAAALASAVAAGAIAVAVALALRPEPAKPLRRFAIEFPPGGQQFAGSAGRRSLALSPDGSRLVYAANQRLNMRQLSSLEPVAIPGTNGAVMPFFSPDGRSLAFFQGGQLRRMDATGGPARPVCDTPLPYGASWESDDAIWFGRAADGIWKVPAEGGGAPVQVIKMDASKAEIAQLPQLLRGGEWVLFTLNSGGTARSVSAQMENSQVVVQSLRTNERKTVIAGGSDGRYLPSGHLVYVTQGSLAVVSFDLDRLMVTGQPVYVADRLVQAGGVGVSGGGGVSTSASSPFPPKAHSRTSHGRCWVSIAQSSGWTGPAPRRRLRGRPRGRTYIPGFPLTDRKSRSISATRMRTFTSGTSCARISGDSRSSPGPISRLSGRQTGSASCMAERGGASSPEQLMEPAHPRRSWKRRRFSTRHRTSHRTAAGSS